jgi:hypothetical protein
LSSTRSAARWCATVVVLVAVSAGCAHDDDSYHWHGRGVDLERQQVRQRIVDLNRQAIAAYQDDDFDAAMDGLTKAIEEAKRAGPRLNRLAARTYVHLGTVSFVGYGDRAKALESFAMAKKIRPTIHLTPAIATPALRALFDQAPSAPMPQPTPRAAGRLEPDLPSTFGRPLACSTPTHWPPGQDLFVRCGVEPTLNAESVRIYYRASAEESFQTVRMRRSPRGWYVVTIPGSVMEAYNLQVYFDASDDNGHDVATDGKPDKPSIIRICEDKLSCDFPDLGDFDPDDDDRIKLHGPFGVPLDANR